MAQLLAKLASTRADEHALASRDRELTWAALDDRVNRWIGVLRGQGLSTGDTISLVLRNRPEVFELLLACLHSGITVVPVNWHLTAPEIAHIVTDSASKAVLTDAESAGVVRKSQPPCPVLELTALERLLAQTASGEPEDQCCGSLMLYTSGTTGRPKGVVNGVFRRGEPLPQVGRLLSYAGLVLGAPSSGTALLAGPWYHSAQLYFALLPLLRGCRLFVEERFDPADFLRLVDLEQVSVCHLVPTQFVRLLRLPGEAREAFSGKSLRRVWHGGGPCAPDVKARMIDWWGDAVVEYYAATEGGVVTMIDAQEWLAKRGSVGRAIAPTRIYIADTEGNELPPGDVGRVFFRRAAAQDFRYHGDDEKTRSAHLGSSLYTYGELGYVDDDGYLFLTGRASHTIVSGGVNIYPAEVEAELLAHDSVDDVAVVGIPDEEFGERVLAIVQLAPGLSEQEAPAVLEQHCRTRLAGFKIPRVWRFAATLPRDETGKLRRDALAAWRA